MGQAPRHPLLTNYFPAIDGLRAVAILAVFAHHIIDPVLPGTILWWGWTGVDLFFVISGFLITGILYDTIADPNYFRNFYARRALRIFPLFYSVWIVLLILSIRFPADWCRGHLFDAIYLENFVAPSQILHHHGQALAVLFRRPSGKTFGIDIAHFWSLSLEEQFYLLWPLIIWLVRRRRTLMIFSGVAIICVPLLRVYLYLHYSVAQLQAQTLNISSYTRFDTLLLGGWFALWLRAENAPSIHSLRRISHWLIAVPLLIIVIGQATIGRHWPLTLNNPLICTYGLTLIGLIAIGMVLLCLNPDTALARLMRKRPMVHLGRISYGFYVIHFLFIFQILDLERRLAPRHLAFLIPIAAFAGTYALSWLSYTFLELPFLRLKKHFVGSKHSTEPIPVAVG